MKSLSNLDKKREKAQNNNNPSAIQEFKNYKVIFTNKQDKALAAKLVFHRQKVKIARKIL